ncbi:DUF3310 domain-containing protein [Spirillospora sp. NPDC047279]|uniref:DUF3310 domain-containing protein n=1 Tax=Spirillospora sp. NPDC047279 TaxID=3155478 RepID=UPI0033F040E9
MRTAIGQVWADDDGDEWVVGSDYQLRLKGYETGRGLDFLRVYDEVGPLRLVKDAEEPLADWEKELLQQGDPVNHPSHYTWLPNGVEVIDITARFSFVRGNAIKYLMRADHKGRTLEDLRKARWYLDYEIREMEQGEAA